MEVSSPRTREEIWTDIDIHFRNGDIHQPTLRPGDVIEDRGEEIGIKLNRPPYSLITLYKADLRMLEITQRTVQIPLDEKGQPVESSTEEEDAPGTSDSTDPSLPL